MMENSAQCGSRLCVGALGVSLGVLSALGILIIGLLAHFLHYGQSWVTLVSSVYIGFAATPVGIAIGMVWGFVDGFICGAIIALVYNCVSKCCKCKCCKPDANKTV
jgi:hypothetical protein